MYFNVHMPVTSLDRAPVKHSGLCSIKYFRHEDVLTWPELHPVYGYIKDSIELKPDTYLYFAEAADSFRSFQESSKKSEAGDYFDISVEATLRGSSIGNILSLQTMMYHQWGIIVEDRNGVSRLIGNQDSGAKLMYDYTSGNRTDSRKTQLRWQWEHPNAAPVYGAQAFNIVIGGIIITAGCIKLHKRFRVGAPGAPMVEGDTLLTDPLFPNAKFLVIAGGLALPLDDGTSSIGFDSAIERHIYKPLASDTIEFVGSVIDQEIIEIYAWS